MHSKKWTKVWFYIVSIIPIVIVLNYIIDPYGYFSRDDKFIFNLTRMNKPRVTNNKLHSNGDVYLIGTSRQRRINPQLIEEYTDKKVHNVNIPGATLSENILLAQKVKKLGKHFIYEFDCYPLNEYRIKNYKDIENRYLAYKNEFKQDRNIFLSLFDLDIIFLSGEVIIKSLLQKDYFDVETMENNKQYDYTVTQNIDQFNGKSKKSSYMNFTLYSDEIIVKLAKIADENDIFVIYPKHIFYYKMFQKYQNIEDKYFHAIKLLVQNTKAKVWIFYGKNNITINRNYFDIDGSHFKPKVANMIFSHIFNNTAEETVQNFGVLLTKDNIDNKLNHLSEEIKNYDLNVTTRK